MGSWYKSKNIISNRMGEIIAEKKVAANAEAYCKMKHIQSGLTQDSLKNISTYIRKNEEWFFSNRLFLPGKFPNKWLQIRNMVEDADMCVGISGQSDKLRSFKKKLTKLAAEAGSEIIKEMGLKAITLEG